MTDTNITKDHKTPLKPEAVKFVNGKVLRTQSTGYEQVNFNGTNTMNFPSTSNEVESSDNFVQTNGTSLTVPSTVNTNTDTSKIAKPSLNVHANAYVPKFQKTNTSTTTSTVIPTNVVPSIEPKVGYQNYSKFPITQTGYTTPYNYNTGNTIPIIPMNNVNISSSVMMGSYNYYNNSQTQYGSQMMNNVQTNSFNNVPVNSTAPLKGDVKISKLT